MNTPQIIRLVVSIVLPLGIGAFAGMFTSQAIPGWYNTLNSPSFSPPNWIFGPVWTMLYIVMGISLYLIWDLPPDNERNLALIAFGVQLLFNFCWSFIFFYFKMIGFAFLEIVVLWICIVFMLILFYRIKPMAAYINLPYLLWVSFATILNAGYYFLNRN